MLLFCVAILVHSPSIAFVSSFYAKISGGRSSDVFSPTVVILSKLISVYNSFKQSIFDRLKKFDFRFGHIATSTNASAFFESVVFVYALIPCSMAQYVPFDANLILVFACIITFLTKIHF